MLHSKADAVPIVTLRTLLGVELPGLEAAIGPAQQEDISHATNASSRSCCEETARTGSDVLITVQDRDTSMLQSLIAEEGDAGPPLPEAAAKPRSKVRHRPYRRRHRGLVPQRVRLDRPKPMASDRAATRQQGRDRWPTQVEFPCWVTGAPTSTARRCRRRPSPVHTGYELPLHLGDIYYSGTKPEVKQRFLDAWPTSAAKVSRALNGDHEMYSGGFASFDDILPKFEQPSTYFALQNTNWLLVGLDTAHTNHALDTQQVAWLKSVVEKAGQRKLILFSHHHLSRLDKQGPNLQNTLADLFQKKAITAWYWGHEHNCIIYDKHPTFGLLGRCIGHGGIPSPRKREVVNAPAYRRLNGIAWKRLLAIPDAPSCLVLDGPNPLVKGEEQKFGPHGYLTLDFDGPNLIERVHLPDGTEIFKEQVL